VKGEKDRAAELAAFAEALGFKLQPWQRALLAQLAEKGPVPVEPRPIVGFAMRKRTPESFGWLRRPEYDAALGGRCYEKPNGNLAVLSRGVKLVCMPVWKRA
jgi:hypothetical protein